MTMLKERKWNTWFPAAAVITTTGTSLKTLDMIKYYFDGPPNIHSY